MSFDARTLAPAGVFVSSPDGDDAGIWQSDTGPAADAYGRFAALADDGDGGSALLALAMVRHGPALYRSEWSITEGHVRSSACHGASMPRPPASLIAPISTRGSGQSSQCW